MKRKIYSTDLSDEEWALMSELAPPAKYGRRPRTTDIREVLNAVFYVLRAGCAWRLLPHDFPCWKTVYHDWRQWRIGGLCERINETLRRSLRKKPGREAEPAAAVIDSQSIKTTERGGLHGYDGGKKISGGKRHLLVDTVGLLLKAKVHAADILDLYYLLKESDGAAIGQFVRSVSKMHKISQTIFSLRSELDDEVNVAALAKAANMSRSVFFKFF